MCTLLVALLKAKSHDPRGQQQRANYREDVDERQGFTDVNGRSRQPDKAGNKGSRTPGDQHRDARR
jgi:hypothetical protein